MIHSNEIPKNQKNLSEFFPLFLKIKAVYQKTKDETKQMINKREKMKK